MRPWDDLGPKPSPLHRHPLFWALLGLPPASLAGLYAVEGIARALRRRRGTVRPQDVFRRSEATLRRTARGRSREEPATQIAAVEGALLDYLEARLGEPLRGYAAGELCRRLVAAGFPEATVDRLAAQLEACAFGRFAPSASRRQGAEETARAALDLLRDLESAGGSAGGNHE
jgi:L-alanine-DL-glutamate epimerase-like enolase superfamily enzyme